MAKFKQGSLLETAIPVMIVDEQGDQMAGAAPAPVLVSPDDTSAPGPNQVATVSYPATAGAAHVISGVAWSYTAAPAGGQLIITSGPTVFNIDITVGGPGFIPFDPPKRGATGSLLSVRLTAGGAGISGKVNVLGHWTV